MSEDAANPAEPRIPAEQLAALVEIDPVLSLLPFAWTWAIIAATIAAQTLWGTLLTLPLALLLIARSQHALAILMHEGAHARIHRSRRTNDLIAGWLAGYPVLISLPAYRRAHLVHHKDPLAATDPDLVLTSGYPVTLPTLLRRLARDLSGISFLKVLSYVITGTTLRARRRARTQPRTHHAGQAPYTLRDAKSEIARALLAQLALFAIAAAFGHPEAYLLLWLLPLTTVLQVLLRLRGLADHAGLPEPTADTPLPQHLRTRTVISNPITRFFLAPLDVGYHLEHHLYLGLPWYRLRAAHQLLRPAFEANGAAIERGYGTVLKKLLSA